MKLLGSAGIARLRSYRILAVVLTMGKALVVSSKRNQMLSRIHVNDLTCLFNYDCLVSITIIRKSYQNVLVNNVWIIAD